MMLLGEKPPHLSRSSSSQSTTWTDSTIHNDLNVKIEVNASTLSVDATGSVAVLAARKGLYVIDLESPYQPSRTLHHQTKWDVTVVKCNPHVLYKGLVASTSNHNTLLWNIDHNNTNNGFQGVLSSHQPLIATLRAHTRPVSDVAWSPSEPTILATCSADTKTHLWDIRTPQKPVQTLCAFTTSATHVEWNRLDRRRWRPRTTASLRNYVLPRSPVTSVLNESIAEDEREVPVLATAPTEEAVVLLSSAPKDRARYDQYKTAYGDVLYHYGALNTRCEMLKHLETTPAPHEGLTLALYCHACGHPTSDLYCAQCKDFSVKCSVCELVVRGESMYCVSCGHGGHRTHLTTWFATESACPTGCGCWCNQAKDAMEFALTLSPPPTASTSLLRSVSF
ncbi:hypothetical protein SPRG_21441 [Saprolegnia parasitica CBS 223.65]|uniref:WDR59/RTC1-like RING zinc finger domain-containing protein n=1 Tax=Saprolegnia parasitica (strain CBS 223.65) TaxID=695850 RepID=A0A067BTC6_SAPPC|nr:hypothetical protein SPRG_21441 [Saprolegnia parasitica CBS 223.65]KDO20080.1 hypothetical protein SPRG_21441 [Saprolegnia parasitica CBS 223.65]|eukprot:XP_012209211.1 hypothetical protein SPRG_21441 [Saprolegnia parasitica CBS 223.65]